MDSDVATDTKMLPVPNVFLGLLPITGINRDTSFNTFRLIFDKESINICQHQ